MMGSIEFVAVPLGGQSIQPTGAYKFGHGGMVDFDKQTRAACSCGACCVAGNPPETMGAWNTSVHIRWLEQIRAGTGEPEIERIVELGCRCCNQKAIRCTCNVLRARIETNQGDEYREVCLVHCRRVCA